MVHRLVETRNDSQVKAIPAIRAEQPKSCRSAKGIRSKRSTNRNVVGQWYSWLLEDRWYCWYHSDTPRPSGWPSCISHLHFSLLPPIHIRSDRCFPLSSFEPNGYFFFGSSYINTYLGWPPITLVCLQQGRQQFLRHHLLSVAKAFISEAEPSIP